MLGLNRMNATHRFINMIMLLFILVVSCDVAAQTQLNGKRTWTLTDSLVYIGSVYWCLKEEGYITNTQAGESVRTIVYDFMSENKISMERLKNILSDHDFDKRLEAEIDAAGGCRQLAESFIKEAMSK
jgi:hypothetical protein